MNSDQRLATLRTVTTMRREAAVARVDGLTRIADLYDAAGDVLTADPTITGRRLLDRVVELVGVTGHPTPATPPKNSPNGRTR